MNRIILFTTGTAVPMITIGRAEIPFAVMLSIYFSSKKINMIDVEKQTDSLKNNYHKVALPSPRGEGPGVRSGKYVMLSEVEAAAKRLERKTRLPPSAAADLTKFLVYTF